MQPNEAVAALSALAHDHRLAVFRLLVERGPEGLCAGEIADRLALAPSSLTFHTQALVRAGLVRQQRKSRRIIYSADFSGMNALVAFLTEKCCQEASDGVCAIECAPAAAAAKRKKRRA